MSFNVTSMCCITIATIPEQTSVGEGIAYVNVKKVDCYVNMKVRSLTYIIDSLNYKENTKEQC